MLWPNVTVYWLLIFFRAELDIVLPKPGKYATGMMFIEAREQDEVRTEFTKMATQMQLEVSSRVNMSRLIRKLVFCKCENKDADQLCCYSAADQCLCFPYLDSAVPLHVLPETEISGLHFFMLV